MNNNQNQEDLLNYNDMLEQELQLEKNKNLHLLNATQSSAFGMESEDNLIRYQLDLKEDLDKIYHLLRGDILMRDEKGSKYVENENDESKPFNEFGVQLIMNIISFYMNRNTLLSNYDEQTINWKVLDFGNEISDLILCRYEDMMVTTSFEKEFKKLFDIICYKDVIGDFYIKKTDGEFIKKVYLDYDIQKLIENKLKEHMDHKIKLYPMIVQELIDSVHSTFLRSLKGGERESLRTARVVTQNDNLRINPTMMNMQTKKFSLRHPSTWL